MTDQGKNVKLLIPENYSHLLDSSPRSPEKECDICCDETKNTCKMGHHICGSCKKRTGTECPICDPNSGKKNKKNREAGNWNLMQMQTLGEWFEYRFGKELTPNEYFYDTYDQFYEFSNGNTDLIPNLDQYYIEKSYVGMIVPDLNGKYTAINSVIAKYHFVEGEPIPQKYLTTMKQEYDRLRRKQGI